MPALGKKIALIGICAVTLISAVHVPVASAEEMEVVPAKVEKAHWNVAVRPPERQLVVKGHNIALLISTGYCLGEPKPKVDHVKVVERPQTKQRPFKYGSFSPPRKVWPRP